MIMMMMVGWMNVILKMCKAKLNAVSFAKQYFKDHLDAFFRFLQVFEMSDLNSASVSIQQLTTKW